MHDEPCDKFRGCILIKDHEPYVTTHWDGVHYTQLGHLLKADESMFKKKDKTPELTMEFEKINCGTYWFEGVKISGPKMDVLNVVERLLDIADKYKRVSQ